MQCKQRLLATLQQLVDLEEKCMRIAARNKTKQHNNVVQKYLLFSQILRLCDEKLQIDPSVPNKVVFLQISQLFQQFISREFLHLPSFVFKKWTHKIIYFKCTPENSDLHFHSGHLHFSRQFLFEKRRHTVENMQLQLMIQQQLNEQEAIIELELPELEEASPIHISYQRVWEEEEMKNMTIDEACQIIQNIERIYQAKSRRRYLQEVKQKAIGLGEKKEPLDPEKAIVRIQAITRGFLTRKETRKMREEENTALGLTTKGLLMALNTPKMAPVVTQVHIPDEYCNFTTTLAEILEFLKSNYFITEKDENEEPETMPKSNMFSELSESQFQTLVSLGLTTCPQLDIYSLVTVKVVVRSAGKSSHSILFDLRSYLIATVVIPHSLSAFPNTIFKRNNVIFVGRPKSGRSSWSEAVANFSRATFLRIHKRSFRKKAMGMQKMCQKLLQFAHSDAYCVVEIGNLEMFKSSLRKSKANIKKTYRTLISSLTANAHVQVIGISTTDDLESSILEKFNSVIYFGHLDNFERFEIIANTLASRLSSGKLSEAPKMTVKTEKITRNMNCGEIVEKVDSMFVRR